MACSRSIATRRPTLRRRTAGGIGRSRHSRRPRSSRRSRCRPRPSPSARFCPEPSRMTSARALIGVSAIVAAILVAQACAKTSTRPAPRLGALVSAYDREVTPYHPFTASEAGRRQYDRVLANYLGEEYRTGPAALGPRYLNHLRLIGPAPLAHRDAGAREVLR